MLGRLFAQVLGSLFGVYSGDGSEDCSGDFLGRLLGKFLGGTVSKAATIVRKLNEDCVRSGLRCVKSVHKTDVELENEIRRAVDWRTGTFDVDEGGVSSADADADEYLVFTVLIAFRSGGFQVLHEGVRI